MNRWHETLCVCRSAMLVLVLLLVASLVANAREIVVISTADSGTGTLRWALETARSGDTITFNPVVFPPSDPATISPQTELPAITCGGLAIDASNVGILIDGANVPGDWKNGLQVYSSYNTIMGLQVVNFAGSGIVVAQGINNTIGGDRSVGSGPVGQGNLVSGNGIGIDLCDIGTSNNRIVGNLVGVQVDGRTPWPNRGSGIFIEPGATHNYIGPWNVIACNGSDGVTVLGADAHSNTITRNAIFGNVEGGITLIDGANELSTRPVLGDVDLSSGRVAGIACPNCIVEIYSDQLGQGEVLEVIAVADDQGAFLVQTGQGLAGPNITAIATTLDGSTSSFSDPFMGEQACTSMRQRPLSSEFAAIEILATSIDDSGYGTFRWAMETARPGNVIRFDPETFPPDDPAIINLQTELPPLRCGNVTVDASDAGVILDGSDVTDEWATGIQIYSDENVIMGLQIINFDGAGITVGGSTENRIGGDRTIGEGPTGQGNLLSSNRMGIVVCDVAASDNAVIGNLIGVQADGITPSGNSMSGVFIESGATRNTIGPENIIAHNAMDGVGIMDSGTHSNTITRNTIFKNGEGIYMMDMYDIHLCNGGNAGLEAPTFTRLEGLRTIAGTATPNSTIEVFSGRCHAEAFEGETVCDDEGAFLYHTSSAFIGSHVLCTATDPLGNTSSFSSPMAVVPMQEGSASIRVLLESRPSSELADNRIGSSWNGFWQPVDMLGVAHHGIFDVGLKRAMLTVNACEAVTAGKIAIDLARSEFEVEPSHDAVFSVVAENGVQITYSLVFWDKDIPTTEDVLSGPRFKTEDQIARYLDFVRFTVGHFEDRVQRYEIWGEPNVDMPGLWGKHIDVEDYIELVRRVVPVIREESPDAMIHVGATSGLREESSQAYLSEILRSDIMPLVNTVTWHPLYGESPEHEAGYYYEYPSIVRHLIDLTRSHGFSGEFEADEVTWWTIGEENDQPWRYSALHAAKYYARSILLHLGMDVTICVGGSDKRPVLGPTIQNLCTVMAGHEAIDMPVAIDIETDSPVAYCAFRYPNGGRMLAVWTDGIAQDEDPGVPATITFEGLAAGSAAGIDVLHGFEQELVFEIDGDDTIVRDLLVKDYPILIQLSDITFGSDYEETVGDGFHRLGEP